MLIPQRQSRLQELLARRGISDLDTLARELNVSQSTIRRDVDQLEKRQLVTRTHGGVIWLTDNPEGGSVFSVLLPGPKGGLLPNRLNDLHVDIA